MEGLLLAILVVWVINHFVTTKMDSDIIEQYEILYKASLETNNLLKKENIKLREKKE